MQRPILKASRLFLYLFVGILLVGCNNDDDNAIASQFEATNLPDDVSKLFVTKGNTSSKTVVIFAEGGPSDELSADDLESINLDGFTGFNDFLRVYIHQIGTYNSNIFKFDATVAEATRETDLNTEILDRVIKHYKSQDKVVFVIGHSYGAWAIARYIADKGNTSADKFVMMAGRLDIEQKVVDNLFKGNRYFFRDGVTLYNDPEERATDKETELIYFYAGIMIKDRYTERIKATDLSNVICVFANDDEQSGRMTASEKNFLKSKNVDLLEIDKGGHSIMFETPYIQQIFDKITK